ncbi:hypothetical protein AB0C51_14700 [Streptomyces pathocidini]|uniref:hypothetical protein n=1 Tax=Streptomyces pathocidini TaxID=1650571 RepID=UPI0033FCC1C4
MLRTSRFRNRKLWSLFGAALLGIGLAVVPASSAQAASIPVFCSETSLVNAINLANSTAAADQLAFTPFCTITLTTPHGGSAASGFTGLPEIRTPMTFAGFLVTIRRAPTAPDFRIAAVQGAPLFPGTSGSLNFVGLFSIENGRLPNQSPPLVGGGVIVQGGNLQMAGASIKSNTAGAGGGVYLDTGAVNMAAGQITGNTALVTGGGLYINAGTVTNIGGTISNNSPNNCVSVPVTPGCNP